MSGAAKWNSFFKKWSIIFNCDYDLYEFRVPDCTPARAINIATRYSEFIQKRAFCRRQCLAFPLVKRAHGCVTGSRIWRDFFMGRSIRDIIQFNGIYEKALFGWSEWSRLLLRETIFAIFWKSNSRIYNIELVIYRKMLSWDNIFKSALLKVQKYIK